MSFYRFAKMEADSRHHLYVDGVLESDRPWWDEDGAVRCPEDFRAGMEAAGDGELTVHINSPGGDLSAGIAIFEMLRTRKGKTRCEITWAASAATLIPCGCTESMISPAGVMMIHNPQVMAVGDDVELEKAQKAFKAWKSAAIAAYKQRIPKSEEEISRMMQDEIYLNAQAAVDLGLCDGILPAGNERPAMQYNRQAVMLKEQKSFAQMGRKKDDVIFPHHQHRVHSHTIVEIGGHTHGREFFEPTMSSDEQKERAALLEWAKG